MKPVMANNINALILIAVGLYGYFVLAENQEARSMTALIPAYFGLVLVLIGLFWKKAPRIFAHIASVLVLLLFVMCIIRFIKVDSWLPRKYVFLICILSNFFALFFLIKSFVDARVLKKNDKGEI